MCILISLINIIQATNAGVDNNRNTITDSLHETLIAIGYKKIQLRKGDNTGWWYVDAVIGSKPAILMIDTGASGFGTLTVNSAKQLGIKTTPSSAVGPFMQQPSVAIHHDVYINICLGSMLTSAIPFGVYEDKQLMGFTSRDELPSAVGLLGSSWLACQSAVIDYGNGALYLLPPTLAEPDLAGEWTAVAIQSRGISKTFISGERKLFLGTSGYMRHTWPNSTQVGQYTIDTAKSPRTIEWHIPFTDLERTPGGFSESFLYSVKDDELILCGRVYNRRTSGIIKLSKFDGSVDSPYDLVTFRRMRERAPLPRRLP